MQILIYRAVCFRTSCPKRIVPSGLGESWNLRIIRSFAPEQKPPGMTRTFRAPAGYETGIVETGRTLYGNKGLTKDRLHVIMFKR